MTNFDPNQVTSIFNTVVTLLALIGVPTLVVIAAKSKRIINDAKDILVNAAQASNDGKLTSQELENIVNDIKDLVGAGEDIITAIKPAVSTTPSPSTVTPPPTVTSQPSPTTSTQKTS